MEAVGMAQCTPRLRPEDRNMTTRPWIEDFSAGYMQRAMHLMPRQGDRAPWLNTQNFAEDKKMIRRAPLEDGALQFAHPLTGDAAGAGASDESPVDRQTASAA
jgi:hypothetical protein